MVVQSRRRCAVTPALRNGVHFVYAAAARGGVETVGVESLGGDDGQRNVKVLAVPADGCVVSDIVVGVTEVVEVLGSFVGVYLRYDCGYEKETEY
ncbi:hypothetical protein GYH30_055786 [Glycine max]|nr:hypothetical protein GYH30_055786 [Glycine max]